MKNNKDPDIPVRKQYHPAFCNAMELEFYEDRELLEFQEGIELNTLPREIDFIIIRKDKPGEIKSELGKFFRKYNIWEFKGYGDDLDWSVFYKSMSYAYDYLILHHEVSGLRDITLSFLREGRANTLISWLENDGYEKVPSPKWVERFRKTGFPDVQIINIAHEGAPVFLKVLSHKAEPGDIGDVAAQVSKMTDDMRQKVRLVIELSYKINGDLRGGDNMGGFFETYVDPLEATIKEMRIEIEHNKEEYAEELERKDEELERKDEELEKKNEEIARLKALLAAK